MRKTHLYLLCLCVAGTLFTACKKDEESISPEEKMLTAQTWTVTEVYVNEMPSANPPQKLMGAKIKFNATNPGTINLNGAQYPGSVWVFNPTTKTKLLINPGTSAQFSPNISKLENTQLWLKFQAEVPFLGFQLSPSTELRMTPAVQ